MANVHEEGKRVAPPPRPQGSPDWCPALAAAFESEPEFQAAMLALTPGRQREYNDHVGSAKREATQLARLDKIRPLVLAGKGLTEDEVPQMTPVCGPPPGNSALVNRDSHVGVLRAFWVAAEHGAGVRTAHLEWVEPSYGVFLLVGVPAVWVALSRK